MSNENNFEFAVLTMQRCSGNTENDALYMKWFIDQCQTRIICAAKAINEVVEGRTIIEADTEAKTIAHMANIRLNMSVLTTCADFFKNKPVVANNFTNAYDRCKVDANKSEVNIKRLFFVLNEPIQF